MRASTSGRTCSGQCQNRWQRAAGYVSVRGRTQLRVATPHNLIQHLDTDVNKLLGESPAPVQPVASPSPAAALTPTTAAVDPALPSTSDRQQHAATTEARAEAQPAASTSQTQTQDQAAKKGQGFANRVIYGTALGLGGGAIVLIGQLPFLVAVILITYQATKEYYGFITSGGIAKGMAPPPPVVGLLSTVLCTGMALLAYFYKGKSGTVLAVSAFLLLVVQVITVRRPKFSQLASSLFGLFYCGWLPSFWVKLRMLPFLAPALPYTSVLGGFTAWTVGLVATLTTVACVIAADTGAYFVGKNLGRTKLTDISPKKTVEGAFGGLVSSVAVALASWKVAQWPTEPLAAAVFGVLVFFSSLFGDLIESIMKRDAGMKDSGDLIPGHGGLLDRVDSYMFTGAVTYFYIVFILPHFGLPVAA